MPLPPPIIPPRYPNVPMAPGVPPLLRQVGQIQNVTTLLAADAGRFINMFAPPQWGIFLDGAPAITGDNVIDLTFRNDFRITTAPQEQGAFVSYNKVSDPFDGRVTFTQGGTIAERTAFLAQAQAALLSLGLYSLVMPEFTFPNVNVVHYDFRRAVERGATLLIVEVWVEQVRVTGTAAFSNTVAPAAADPKNGGTVQAQPPTPSQSGTINQADPRQEPG